MNFSYTPGSGLLHDRGSRILIVDDDASVRYVCAEALGKYEILQAENGRKAMDLLERFEFDLVLTDVMMPEMNGIDLLEAVKGKNPNQAVAVMTSFAEREIILKALKGGADDFIEKPVDILIARTVVERVLEKKALKEELFHLKQMDKLKSDFLGLISHKLKTPITVISLSTQVLAEKAKDYSDADFSKNLAVTREQAAYLITLVEELLRFSDAILQEEKLQLKQTDLKGLLERCVDQVRDAASRQGVGIEVHCGSPLPTLLLDGKRIEFALHALLDNAVKFTGQGGKVSIAAAVDDSEIRITVADKGIGIPPEEQAKVFEKFYQIDPDCTGQVRGFGLGLFYARTFIRDHGGNIELQSTPGEGTTATVTLPLSTV